jgi:hypothetical protein
MIRRRFAVLLGVSLAAVAGAVAFGDDCPCQEALKCPGAFKDVICGTGNNCTCDTTVSPALCETTSVL